MFSRRNGNQGGRRVLRNPYAYDNSYSEQRYGPQYHASRLRSNPSSNARPMNNLQEYEDELFELHVSGFPKELVNGRYQFLKMSPSQNEQDSRPVFEHETNKAVIGWWARSKSWVICRDERSFDTLRSYSAYAYVREDKYNPARLTKQWRWQEQMYKWVLLNDSLTITALTRTEARGNSLNKYKPGRYQLKGHLPVYEACGSLEHTQMLERHCLIDVTAIHANTEDESSDLIYGQCEHGFVPLGEYHGKEFTTRISDIPEPTEEEESN